MILALLAGCFFLLRRFMKETIYQFRCVAAVGAMTCLVLLLVQTVFRPGITLWELVKAFPPAYASLAIWLIGLLGVLMFVSNISLMRHEGMRPHNLVGTFLGAIYVLGTLLLFVLTKWMRRSALSLESELLRGIFRFLPVFFYCLLDYAECIMLGIAVMGYIAAGQRPRYDKDFIIILGCSISKNGGLLPLLRSRVTSAVKYAWAQEIATGKSLKYVPSGGQGEDEIMSEGSAMELFLCTHGAEPYEVYPEKRSTSTYENFAFSRALIDEKMPHAKIAFATTNYHVLRSGMIAHKMGMDLEGIGSTTKWYFWPNGFAREVVAIFKMNIPYHLVFIGLSAVFAVLCTVL